MMMTVGKLRDLLDDFDENAPVHIVLEQYMPMEYGTLEPELVAAGPVYDEEPEGPHTEDTVYLVTGQQIGYLNGRASQELGLRR